MEQAVNPDLPRHEAEPFLQDDIEPLKPEPYFPDLSSFVRHVVVAAMLPRVDGRTRTWCPRWWEHPGVVMRLEALWRSWELSRAMQDDFAMSCWIRDHADYHVERLLDPDGPFRGCSPDRGHQPRGGTVPWDEPPPQL